MTVYHVCKHPGCFASLVLGSRKPFCTYHSTADMARWRDAMERGKKIMQRCQERTGT